MHKYILHSQKIENKYYVIRNATWRIRNVNNCGVFEDGEYIYTTEKIDENIPNADFSVEYQGEVLLEVLENRKVYCDLIKYYIIKNLEEVNIDYKSKLYRKYSCKSDNVTSKWIMTDKGFQLVSSKNKEIKLEREYDFSYNKYKK